MIRSVVFDVGETLLDDTREWAAWSDWLGVPRHTFSAVLGAVTAEGRNAGMGFTEFFCLLWTRMRRDSARRGGKCRTYREEFTGLTSDAVRHTSRGATGGCHGLMYASWRCINPCAGRPRRRSPCRTPSLRPADGMSAATTGPHSSSMALRTDEGR
jgi:hypothetical protein